MVKARQLLIFLVFLTSFVAVQLCQFHSCSEDSQAYGDQITQQNAHSEDAQQSSPCAADGDTDCCGFGQALPMSELKFSMNLSETILQPHFAYAFSKISSYLSGLERPPKVA